MKVLVFGASGMLGHQLCKALSNRVETWGTVHENAKGYTQYGFLPEERLISQVDALDLDKIANVLDEIQPDCVINAIGLVKQRDEAKQAIPSIQINALFPHQLASLCRKMDARLVHISTDCVFSGLRGGYSEADVPDPMDLYGRTKLLGELNFPGCLTLRTSIIGWEICGNSSLLEWFARQRGRSIKGYKKAIFSGFSSSVLANLIGDLVETRPDLQGLYQVASQPISKYELLLRLRDTLGWEDIRINADSQFLCDRSLKGTRFEAATGWQSPTWDEMINQLAEDWLQYARWRGQTV
jgi:dTDP-4-dehydrorhamnose reductase